MEMMSLGASCIVMEMMSLGASCAAMVRSMAVLLMVRSIVSCGARAGAGA